MKKKEIIEMFKEATVTSMMPTEPHGGFDIRRILPGSVVDSWRSCIDYDRKMKIKHSYHNVVNRIMSRGYKGHLTKTQNMLLKEIEKHKLEPKKTLDMLNRHMPMNEY